MAFNHIQLLVVLVFNCLLMPIDSYQLNTKVPTFGRLGGQKWSEFDDFEGFNVKILGPSSGTIFNHLGDYNPQNSRDETDKRKNDAYNLNVGKALEVLRRELPFVFVLSNLDYSIFAPMITVADGNNNKMVMPISIYSGAVKSLKIAASFSSMYPSMNVKKIEYIEDSATIQCLVDVVLPDSVRVEGQAVWEGMFYFGLDNSGLISSHIFDRKISNLKPTPVIATGQFPWIQKRSSWQADLLTGVAPKIPVFASSHSAGSSESTVVSSSSNQDNN